MGDVAPGRYTKTVDDVRLAFEVVETDWGASIWGVLRGPDFNESLGFWKPDQVGTHECDPEAHRHVGPAVSDLADAIAALPGVEVSKPRHATVGGHSATFLEVVVPVAGCPTDVIDPSGPGYLWGRESDIYPNAAGLQHGVRAGARILLWIVEVDGDRVVIEADLVPSRGPAFEEGARRVVDSITFE